MVEAVVLVVAILLAVVLGYSLGVSDSALELGSLERELDSAQVKVQELASDLDRLKELEKERVELEKAQALALRKAMEWDLG
jgi:Tfp pilus assembly protein PilO